MQPISAVIADDEKPLRDYLRRQLSAIWPELDIVAEAENGVQALALMTRENPDIAFLDIKMPGLSGIEVAAKAAGSCRIVFVTAYDQYAVEAFEKAAVDYLLKPVTRERLEKTVSRLKAALAIPPPNPKELATLLEQLRQKSRKVGPKAYLNWIRSQHRDGVYLIPVGDVVFFKASDKYTVVRTREGETLIRKSIKALSKELDPDLFWQIHRGTIVNVNCIDKVSRALTGRLALKLKDPAETLMVSRSYTHRFRQM